VVGLGTKKTGELTSALLGFGLSGGLVAGVGSLRGASQSSCPRSAGRVGGFEELEGNVGHVAKVSFGEAGRKVKTGLGEENELAEIAESGGSAVGDAIGGESFEDAFEGTMNVEAAVVHREVLAKFGARSSSTGGRCL
jgi:hypothetical protein